MMETGLASGEVLAEFPYVNVFVAWSGDAKSNNQSSSILMDGPKTATARRERMLSSSFYICLGGISLGIALVAVLFLKRTKVKQK